MAARQSSERPPSSSTRGPLLEYVTIPECADCRRFEALLERVLPDYPEVEVHEVAAETARGMAISVERGVLRFPVIVLDDQVIAVESVAEPAFRAALDARRDGR